MSLLDLRSDDALAAAPRYVTPKAPPTSIWADVGNVATAVPRGAAEGLFQVAATGSELAGAVVRRRGVETAEQALKSPFAETFRQAGRELRPDAETSTAAEQVLYQFSRGAAKIIGGAVAGGPLGVGAMALEEAYTQAGELRREGVDPETAKRLGVVQGAGLGLAVLPVAGATLKATAALYLAGGPGGFVAQQALTKQILQSAGYDERAAQVDLLDPLGLAVSALIPAPFAWYGLRQIRMQEAVRSLPDLPPSDVPTPEAPRAEPFPSRPTAVAEAVRAIPQEVEDAARVLLAAERRAASSPVGMADMRTADAHETALARAEEQLANGERVEVSDVAPRVVITGPERDANFRAWFGDSKVVDAEGKPLVVYRGGATENWRDGSQITEFRSTNGPWAGFFTSSQAVAGRFAEAQLPMTIRGGAPAGVFPVYLRMKSPLEIDAQGRPARDFQIDASVLGIKDSPLREQMLGGQYDGMIIRNTGDEGDVFVPLRPEQIKSAIGNSGRFDPNSPSLTDPIADFAANLRAAADEIARVAKEAEPVATPEQFARFYDATQPRAGAGEGGVAARPQGKPRDLRAETITLRREQAVLRRLLECLSG